MSDIIVRDWMSERPTTISPHTKASDAYRLMAEQHIRHLPVMEDDQIVGVVSLGDLRQAHANTDMTGEYILRADAIMHANPVVIAVDATIRDAAKTMLWNKIGCLPVVQDGLLVGIVTETDLIRALLYDPADSAARDDILDGMAGG